MNRAAQALYWYLAAWLMASLAACSSVSDKQAAAPASASNAQRSKDPPASRAERDLQRGISSYEDADYELAARQLQSALNRGLTRRTDKATAYKYLAFIACASGREQTCQREFRKALETDPTFKLAPSEQGHPVWGPAFRSVKSDMTAKAKP